MFTTSTNVSVSVIADITIMLWAAGGAGGEFQYGNHGGGGGYVTGKYSATPGEKLAIYVGGGGQTHRYSRGGPRYDVAEGAGW